MSGPAELAEEELRFRLRGELYRPGDACYEEACAPFDPTVERRPRFLARCTAPEDVVAALAFARQQGLAVAVHGAEHSLVAHTPCDAPGLLIDVSGMRDVDVDPERGVARVGAGASQAEIKTATGLSSQDPLAVQLVTMEGEILRLEAAENSELLAALRAGDGDLGVVTSLELRLPNQGISGLQSH